MQGYFLYVYGPIPHTSSPFNSNHVSTANNSSGKNPFYRKHTEEKHDIILRKEELSAP